MADDDLHIEATKKAARVEVRQREQEKLWVRQ
jgi:hypothetical protein